jgi:N-acetylated-alpha-linked acidic dipeptidase
MRPGSFALLALLAGPPLPHVPICHAQTRDRTAPVFGFRDFTQQAKWDKTFLAIPDPVLAGQHLKTLSKAPHWASSPEDYDTALYVAEKFKAAGLDTKIVPYKVLLNKPVKILIEAFDASGRRIMAGPSPEHVGKAFGGDAFQDDPRILPAFNGSSPSGDVTAQVVYANYGTPADFQRLADLGIDVRDKIVLVRYGSNYRGIKVYDAQLAGAKGILIYSDPADDGFYKGDMYPKGPYRPESAVQRGAVQFLPIYPGDATTPGVASSMNLPDSSRLAADEVQANWPTIPSNPLSYVDAEPILSALGDPQLPHGSQSSGQPGSETLGGNGAVTVHMHLEQDTQLRVIWDVIGAIEGTDPAEKDNWVVAGNHRDAWVFGAVDPCSGTAAMLETVHGLGALLRQGWRPKRRIVIASWDAEEEGLIGSTEWVEEHEDQLKHAVAYFNTDIGVSGREFTASAVPSLRQFVREVTRAVPSPAGGTVYDQWLKAQNSQPRTVDIDFVNPGANGLVDTLRPAAAAEVHVGELGSGSDYTPFLQHEAVPSTDIGSTGPYGVYHSAFDNYNWFIRNADPTFVYEQQQARVFGLEILHMADADVLPYDYQAYGNQVIGYVSQAETRARAAHLALDFTTLQAAARRFACAGAAIRKLQIGAGSGSSPALNTALRAAEQALLNPEGLPRRAWYKHTIYAPGEFTGYAAVVIPGVTEGIDAGDAERSEAQMKQLVAALNRASAVLEAASH